MFKFSVEPRTGNIKVKISGTKGQLKITRAALDALQADAATAIRRSTKEMKMADWSDKRREAALSGD